MAPNNYYPLVSRQADQWLGVEDRSNGGKEARLYIFTEDGAYIQPISQATSWKEFRARKNETANFEATSS